MPAIALLFLCSAAIADETDTDDSGLEVVLVTGVQPGPGLWRVRSGAHDLWILGEVSPFTRKVKWQSRKFDQLLRNSQELLLDFSGYWEADKSDMAAYRKAEKLPKGTALEDVVSPTLHARVAATAKIFAAPPMQELHPFAATNRLVQSAMKKLDMSGFSARFAAEELGRIRSIRTTYIWAAEPAVGERLKNWQHPSNAVCLERLIDAIGDGGDGVKRLANAWAVGDVDALRVLVPAYSFSRDGFRTGECAAAMRGGEQQARDYNAARTLAWVTEAERALRENRDTLAVILMSEIFAPDGYLAALRARGYEVIEPE